jgi:hypothetical protein
MGPGQLVAPREAVRDRSGVSETPATLSATVSRSPSSLPQTPYRAESIGITPFHRHERILKYLNVRIGRTQLGAQRSCR